jgi:hypothetical protein
MHLYVKRNVAGEGFKFRWKKRGGGVPLIFCIAVAMSGRIQRNSAIFHLSDPPPLHF